MADWLGLHEVACAPRPGRPVARRGGLSLDHVRFVEDVHRWRAAFANARGRRFALFFDDGYELGCALFGAWHAGKAVVLPGDAQPGTLARLMPMVDGCAGALPGALETAAVPRGDPPLAPLDLEQVKLVIYTSGSSGQPVAIEKSLRQFDAEIRNLQEAFGARIASQPPLRVFTTVSQQHIYGLLFCTFWALAAGHELAVERLVYPEQMAERLAGA